MLHKIWVKVSWEQKAASSALSTTSLSLTRFGNLLIHDKLFWGQRGEGAMGQRQEG